MKQDNKVIVMVRLDDGDDVKVAVKNTKGSLTLKDKSELIRRLEHYIKPLCDTALYYTVRSWTDGVKNNWKVKTYDELNGIIDSIFETV